MVVDGIQAGIEISIHPPRGGWDRWLKLFGGADPISIHPPRGGWDSRMVRLSVSFSLFQSTHPVGGGTGGIPELALGIPISIHPPRGGWDDQDTPDLFLCLRISIHPPRGGWDKGCNSNEGSRCISIHPPRGGWDSACPSSFHRSDYFNPPTPRGVGPYSALTRDCGGVLQSTHPVGGGTLTSTGYVRRDVISIHPPRGGWDSYSQQKRGRPYHFNPPTPWGVGPPRRTPGRALWPFQSTHPVGGGTWACRRRWNGATHFNPPTPWGVGRYRKTS